MIGVQSKKNRERDFTVGKPIHFIIGGLIGTLVFLVAVWLLVQYLLATS
jgi:putative flippase GtrA